MFKQLSAYTSFAFTAGWSVVSLIGYFQLGWNLGQAIVFINLGFFSLFLNYYLLFIWMYFRDQIVLTYSGKKKNPDLGTLALSIVQTFGFIGNLFLMTCLLAIVSMISVVFVSTYFMKIQKMKVFEFEKIDWGGSFLVLLLIGAVLFVIEFIRFKRIFQAHKTSEKVFDWDAFKPFHRNNKLKLVAYYFGSVMIMMIDGLLNDFNHAGMICFYWLFALNIYWAFIDLRFPVGITPVEGVATEVK
ncbi:MAG: hypothetical protein A3D31_16740 [Candidatus Fluviicola riflensis]|nr:MAG: hypothetical protein CHH17_01680 [Candidatus Fluviicola riflensis]OGS76644.1 MAG: hypothetical protein A3D31_16740 [Candidatus Fluviicola riflensis]OGS83001.1 MAG: hypothetical protein A2724_14620 [Fluviicola sp. RIFCSPHIGHO2_01_FULL_43_53]OGS88375.1 MAG: hypothetical protein A3E30_06245 [Fluviicola sp. RIFCSPHIGHO2_12_FULL_43_24]